MHRRGESRGDILVRVRSLPLASETLAVSSFERIVVENVFLANNRMKFLKANRRTYLYARKEHQSLAYSASSGGRGFARD